MAQIGVENGVGTLVASNLYVRIRSWYLHQNEK